MTILYKLTNADDQTRGETQWGEGVEHTADGGGELCTAAWIHAYVDPVLAVLMDPIHGCFLDSDAHLWECDGDVGVDDGTKVGCTRLKTLRRIPIPEVTTEQRVRFAILCALEVYDDPDWVKWAKGWLDGKNRAAYAAHAAARAAADASYAADAAYAANGDCDVAYAAADAAADAARAAADVDLVAVARKVVGR
jgi:hypothetical protein